MRFVRDSAWNGRWAVELTGTMPPDLRSRSSTPRRARGELAYFVRIDSPQYDSAEGTRYRKAQIWDRFLQPL